MMLERIKEQFAEEEEIFKVVQPDKKRFRRHNLISLWPYLGTVGFIFILTIQKFLSQPDGNVIFLFSSIIVCTVVCTCFFLFHHNNPGYWGKRKDIYYVFTDRGIAYSKKKQVFYIPYKDIRGVAYIVGWNRKKRDCVNFAIGLKGQTTTHEVLLALPEWREILNWVTSKLELPQEKGDTETGDAVKQENNSPEGGGKEENLSVSWQGSPDKIYCKVKRHTGLFLLFAIFWFGYGISLFYVVLGQIIMREQVLMLNLIPLLISIVLFVVILVYKQIKISGYTYTYDKNGIRIQRKGKVDELRYEDMEEILLAMLPYGRKNHIGIIIFEEKPEQQKYRKRLRFQYVANAQEIYKSLVLLRNQASEMSNRADMERKNPNGGDTNENKSGRDNKAP